MRCSVSSLSSTPRRLGLLAAAIALLFGACKTTPSPSPAPPPASYQVAPERLDNEALEAWLSGDEVAAEAALSSRSVTSLSLEEAFLLGELAYGSGDLERAFDLHLEVLSRDPSHPLVILSASRLDGLFSEVLEPEELRLLDRLSDVRASQMHPIAASRLAQLGYKAHRQRWHVSRQAEPLDGSPFGRVSSWRVSPRLSPYRLLDLSTPFTPERDARLADAYLSPALAEDVSVNYRPSRVLSSTRLSPSAPASQGSGIYYLETFATVTADSPQVYWIKHASAGAAKLFIDGVEVLTHQERDYESGQLLRRVKLNPGTHRVLLKLGVEENLREWFNLSFINRDATIAGGSALRFSLDPPQGSTLADASDIALLSAPRRQHQLDPLTLHTEAAIAEASDLELYLSALAAYYDDAEAFRLASRELETRRPEFAALYALRADQVSSLWQLPSDLRADASLKALRQAARLHPESSRYARELGERLLNLGDSREPVELLERARELAVERDASGQITRLRDPAALMQWASYLENKGWDEAAEQAYAQILELAPSHCGAARSLQSLLYARDAYLAPEAITPRADRCVSLGETWIKNLPERYEERLELARVGAARYPYSANDQLDYVRALRAHGDPKQAQAWLERSLERLPWSRSLNEERVDTLFVSQGVEAALRALDEHAARYGQSSWMVWKRAQLTGEMPLQGLLRDAPAMALELASREPVGAGENSGGDEAFYVLDFAAKRYFEDGTSVQLTHTLVRVMTKNAIDRFGETQLPAGAVPVYVRTIKQDGTIKVPARVSGKSTLSMPELAPGDFVEVAYLDYEPSSPISRTQRNGSKFFFKMGSISSLHSEYVIINPGAEVLRFHDAPEPELFTYQGAQAVRFLQRDSPRPVYEPQTVDGEEFLPWVQLAHEGLDTDYELQMQRLLKELVLRESLRLSEQAKRTLDRFIKESRRPSLDETVEALYYTVSDHFESTDTNLSGELSHALLQREGNPMMAIKAAYDRLGVRSDFYVARSAYSPPPTGNVVLDLMHYTSPMLRVVMPESEEVVWIGSVTQDSMFNALPSYYIGERALCISCEAPELATIERNASSPAPHIAQRIAGELSAEGTLSGEFQGRYEGDSARAFRQLMRERKDPRERQKIMESVINALLPGTTVLSYEFGALEERDEPLVITMRIEREQLARRDAPGAPLRLEGELFDPGVAAYYGKLAGRETPLFIGRSADVENVFEIALPASATSSTLRGRQGQWTVESPFGRYEREQRITEDRKLLIRADYDIDVQRVEPERYAAFRAWADEVRQSAVVLAAIK